MRVFMMTDLEGVAGVSTFTADTYPDGRYYDDAKRLLTGEINAAIDGLLTAGATEVLVFDGHGPGAVHYQTLHDRATLLHGRPVAPRAVWQPIVADFDVCIMIGQHAMAGDRFGNLNHTQSSREIASYTLNGEAIGEIAQFALWNGAFGTPLIYLSGDDAACAEASALIPRITTTSVKRGLGRNSAISVSITESHRRLRAGAEEALRRHLAEPLPPHTMPGPFVLDKRFFHTDAADLHEAAMPGLERLDSLTVRYRAERIEDVIFR
jgi:D-amino peptidase